jgi:hypothetical protein
VRWNSRFFCQSQARCHSLTPTRGSELGRQYADAHFKLSANSQKPGHASGFWFSEDDRSVCIGLGPAAEGNLYDRLCVHTGSKQDLASLARVPNTVGTEPHVLA